MPGKGGRVVWTEDVSPRRATPTCSIQIFGCRWARKLKGARREAELAPYWINDSVVKLANPDVLVMHCLPAHRGQEIDAKTLEARARTIFDQAENPLHVQKAILAELASATKLSR